jgi:hypothetical protein
VFLIEDLRTCLTFTKEANVCLAKVKLQDNVDLKCGRTQPLLTGFQFRGEALKGSSAGGWRSGRRRSEVDGGGGTF